MPMIKLLSCPIAPGEGHAAGRRLLGELCGGSLPEIRILERGKPVFTDSPLHFSISHTARHAFCVLSDVPVGLDAEELDRKIRPELAEKILSPGELAQYRRAEDKRLALLTFWVLKEAQVKLSGEGLRSYPNGTDFSLDDPRVQVLEGCLVAIITENDHLEGGNHAV